MPPWCASRSSVVAWGSGPGSRRRSRARSEHRRRAGAHEPRRRAEVGGAPPGSCSTEESALGGVEDSLARLDKPFARREEPAHDLLWPRCRPHAVEEAIPQTARAPRLLDVVERPPSRALRACHRSPRRTARRTFMRKRSRPAAETPSAARASDHLQRPHPPRRRRSDPRGASTSSSRPTFRATLDRASDDLSEAGISLQPLDVRRLLHRHRDAIDELVDCPLLDAVLAQRRQHVRDVVHERGIRADDEDAP